MKKFWQYLGEICFGFWAGAAWSLIPGFFLWMFGPLVQGPNGLLIHQLDFQSGMFIGLALSALVVFFWMENRDMAKPIFLINVGFGFAFMMNCFLNENSSSSEFIKAYALGLGIVLGYLTALAIMRFLLYRLEPEKPKQVKT